MNPSPASARRRFVALAWPLASTLAWLAGSVGAQPQPQPQPQPIRVEGQLYAAEQSLAGSELRLVGAGVFSRVGIKPYAAGLYLAAPAADAAAAVDAPGPKRIRIRMLRELPASEFAKALSKGVRRNSTEAQQKAFVGALAGLVAQIDSIVTARKGDVVDLDYDPAQGMSLRLNGTLEGPALSGPGGSELYAATLRSFVGERPYSPELRAAMLGRKAP
jgi:hypothetical protein